jgi:hypothetical protein
MGEASLHQNAYHGAQRRGHRYYTPREFGGPLPASVPWAPLLRRRWLVENAQAKLWEYYTPAGVLVTPGPL